MHCGKHTPDTGNTKRALRTEAPLKFGSLGRVRERCRRGIVERGRSAWSGGGSARSEVGRRANRGGQRAGWGAIIARVAAGPRPIASTSGGLPQPHLAADGGQHIAHRPAPAAIPAGGGRRRRPAPSLVPGEQEDRVGPDHPLGRGHGRHRVPGLLLAQAQPALELAVQDLDFPALPGPGQEVGRRIRQDPGTGPVPRR